MSGWVWYLRGGLCWLLGHRPVDTNEIWHKVLGPRTCHYCWEPME